MPNRTITQELAEARALVAGLEKKAAARDRNLAALPGLYGYTAATGLMSGIMAAQKRLAEAKAAKTKPVPVAVPVAALRVVKTPVKAPVVTLGKVVVRAAAKPAVAAKAKPAAVAPAVPKRSHHKKVGPVTAKAKPAAVEAPPLLVPLTAEAKKKRAGAIQRVQVTDAIRALIREYTAKPMTVGQISAATGLGASTIFRIRQQMKIKAPVKAPLKEAVTAKAKPAAKPVVKGKGAKAKPVVAAKAKPAVKSGAKAKPVVKAKPAAKLPVKVKAAVAKPKAKVAVKAKPAAKPAVKAKSASKPKAKVKAKAKPAAVPGPKAEVAPAPDATASPAVTPAS